MQSLNRCTHDWSAARIHTTRRVTNRATKIPKLNTQVYAFVVKLTIALCEIQRHVDLVLDICARDDAVDTRALQSCLHEVLCIRGKYARTQILCLWVGKVTHKNIFVLLECYLSLSIFFTLLCHLFEWTFVAVIISMCLHVSRWESDRCLSVRRRISAWLESLNSIFAAQIFEPMVMFNGIAHARKHGSHAIHTGAKRATSLSYHSMCLFCSGTPF